MEPGEALSTAAQIAVAHAGFAGVVVVFRRESVHEWSPINKVRLRLLLTNSILALAFATLGFLMRSGRSSPESSSNFSRPCSSLYELFSFRRNRIVTMENWIQLK